MRFECGLWKRWFRQPIPREEGRLRRASRVGVDHLAPPERWPELAPEGKEVRYISRVEPAIPGRVLHDGTVHKPRPARRVAVPELVEEGSRLPAPTGRKYPRGWTGWKLALFMGLTFGGVLLGSPFGGDFYEAQAASLTALPFVDMTDPANLIPSSGDTAAAQNALTLANGAATYYYGSRTYIATVPILYDPGSMFIGTGPSFRTNTLGRGTIFQVSSAGVAGNWTGQGYFTSRGYANNTVISAGNGPGDTVQFRDFRIDGNSQTFGAGIVTAGIAQPHFINLRLTNFRGNTAFTARGGGAAQVATGFGILLTVYTLNGGAAFSPAGGGANDPYINNIRAVGCNNTCFFTDDDGNSSITDGWLIWVNPLIQNTVQDINGQGAIDINHAGGWHLDFAHLNGWGSDGLVLKNCMATHVTNGWLDWWGGAAANTTYYCLNTSATSGSGGVGGSQDSALTVWGNTVRYRSEQDAPGTYVALRHTANGNDSSLVFSNNNGFIQASDATGTFYIFTLVLGGGTLTANLGTNTFKDGVGAPMGDATFSSGALGAGFTIISNGNTWDFGAAAPTTGNWAKGMLRYVPSPTLNNALSFVCTTAGSPGTWVTVNLVTQKVASFGTTTNTQNPAAAINVTGASFAIGASEEWTCTFDIDATSTGTGGQQYSVTLPAGATCRLHVAGPNTAASNYRQGSTGGTSPFTLSGTVAIANFWVQVVVHVTNSTTAGTVQLQIANVTNSESQSVNSGTLVATRIA